MTKLTMATLGAMLVGLMAVTPSSLARPQVSLDTADGLVLSRESQQALVDQYCVFCHDDVERAGDMTLSELDLDHVGDSAPLVEKMIRKLRSGMMPPAGQPRPDRATLNAFAASLETTLDRIAAANPNPGTRGPSAAQPG